MPSYYYTKFQKNPCVGRNERYPLTDCDKQSNLNSSNTIGSFIIPLSILYKSIAGRYRPVRVADGPMMARYRFIKNACWDG